MRTPFLLKLQEFENTEEASHVKSINEQVNQKTMKFKSMFQNQQYEVVKYINIRNLGKKMMQWVLLSASVSFCEVQVSLKEDERTIWQLTLEDIAVKLSRTVAKSDLLLSLHRIRVSYFLESDLQSVDLSNDLSITSAST